MTGGIPPGLGDGAIVRPPVVIPAAPVDAADVAALDPLTRTWDVADPIQRVYDVNWGARQFYGGDVGDARFSAFTPAGSTDPLPVLYGASDVAGALSETVFHDVPVAGPGKHVAAVTLLPKVFIELRATRPLTLVELTSDGLSRLGLTREQLIESDPRSYAETAQWARALHAHPGSFDGLYWISRQHDTSGALVLFGDRVAMADITVAPTPPLPLSFGAGFDKVCEAAARAGITITGGPAIR